MIIGREKEQRELLTITSIVLSFLSFTPLMKNSFIATGTSISIAPNLPETLSRMMAR